MKFSVLIYILISSQTPDIVEMDTPEAFKARIVSLCYSPDSDNIIIVLIVNSNFVIISYHLFGNWFKFWLHYSLGMLHKNLIKIA